MPAILIAFCLFVTTGIAAGNGDTTDHRSQVRGSATMKRRGTDMVVSVTLKNGSKRTCIDPSVRVTFTNAAGDTVADDAKTYFVRIPKGAAKKLESRIWTSIPDDAVASSVSIDEATFE